MIPFAFWRMPSGGAPPVLSSLNYAQGDTLGGGQPIVLTGTGFTGATLVGFGATSATFTVDSDTQITATLPAHAAAVVDVTVTGPGGSDAMTLAFEFWDPTQEANCSLLFDATSNPFNPATSGGQWVARYASNSASGLTSETLQGVTSANPPPVANGGPDFPGGGTKDPLAGTNGLNTATGYLGTVVGDGQSLPGSVAVVSNGDTGNVVSYNSTQPYSGPNIGGANRQGTLGVGYGLDSDGDNGFAGHIYSNGQGYKKVAVKKNDNALHAIVLRWGAAYPTPNESVDLSVDGATSGTPSTGYDTVTGIYGNTKTYLDSSVVTMGGIYPVIATEHQYLKCNPRAMCFLRVKASDSFVAKHYAWARQRFGVV